MYVQVYKRNDSRALQFHSHLGDLKERYSAALEVSVTGRIAEEAQHEVLDELDNEIQAMLNAIE